MTRSSGTLARRILLDLASRPRDAAEALRGQLDPAVLNAHPAGHPNSLAWLLWHTGREIDVQLAHLSGQPEVWTAQGFGERLGLGEAGRAVGYGHSEGEARAIVVEDGDALVDYVLATADALHDHLGTLTDADLDEAIGEYDGEPITRAVRLVSIIDDAAQHLGQAAYVLGTTDRG